MIRWHIRFFIHIKISVSHSTLITKQKNYQDGNVPGPKIMPRCVFNKKTKFSEDVWKVTKAYSKQYQYQMLYTISGVMKIILLNKSRHPRTHTMGGQAICWAQMPSPVERRLCLWYFKKIFFVLFYFLNSCINIVNLEQFIFLCILMLSEQNALFPGYIRASWSRCVSP